MPPNIDDLCGFLGAPASSGKCQLLLPHYKGTTQLDAGTNVPSMKYRGNSFAERDSRAAFYVQSLLRHVFDASDIEIQPALVQQVVRPTTFLFGSKSNVVTQKFLQPSRAKLFRFEFGAEWKIHCGGKVFSTPDPSTVLPSSYQKTPDYGVIAKLRSSSGFDPVSTKIGSVFIIGGLGGRATEGCGYFFLNHWKDLFQKFGNLNFAVVLKFPPPFALERSEFVATSKALV